MRFFSIYIFEIVRASGNQTINCSDGSNGGCSHNCNWESNTCECPPNWILDTDNSTCIASLVEDENFGHFLPTPCLDGWDETIMLDHRPKTWKEAKQTCFDANMTLITTETEKWTKRTWSAVEDWTPYSPDINADSFQTFWAGYREISGEWYGVDNQTASMHLVSEFSNPVVNNQSISQCLHGVKADSNYTLYELDCETEMAVVCFGCVREYSPPEETPEVNEENIDCSDGANGGCSHYCNAKLSTCECPKNWVLSSDDSTCIPHPNLISVACSSNSMKVELNELIFEGFSAHQISLAFNDSSGIVFYTLLNS